LPLQQKAPLLPQVAHLEFQHNETVLVLSRKEISVAKLKLAVGQVDLMPVHSSQGSPGDQGTPVIPVLTNLQ
jgi:hypothetical protein